MRIKFPGLIWRALVGLLIAAILGGLSFHVVRADQTGWLSTSDPALSKVVDLPSNQSPGISNRDCTTGSYTSINPSNGALSSQSDCFVNSILGSMGQFGTPLVGNGSSIGMAVHGYANDTYLLQPIPNQAMMLSTTSAPVLGSYLHFYTDVTQHFTTLTSGGDSPYGYSINTPPDFDLRDKNNTLIPANASSTLSYSSNGAWMLVDAYGRGFLRINMATFDVTPFAPSLNGPGDNSSQTGITAISDDGRYAAIASDSFHFVRVYDLSTCTGSITNDYMQQLNCQSRDYWPYLNNALSGFRAVYKIRFANDDNLLITTSSNWQSPTSYSVATYRLTAAGKAAHGMDYLALGDSYVSGEGEFTYGKDTDSATNHCHNSPLSYPYLVGADLFNQYQSIACSGAQTKDVTGEGFTDYNHAGRQATGKEANSYNDEIFSSFLPGYRTQIQFVKQYQPSVVTLSIGGNDINFSGMVKRCTSPSLNPGNETCYKTQGERMQVVSAIDGAYGSLLQTYQAILQADPGVRLYITGYPQIAVAGDCAVNVHLSAPEIQFSQQLIGYLDSTIEKAANAAGARYVDFQDAFDGHRLCETASSDVAVNGLTEGNDIAVFGLKAIGNESYHPTVFGHQLLAQTLLHQTNNLREVMPSPDTSITPPSPADQLAQALVTGSTEIGQPAAHINMADELALPDLAFKEQLLPVSVDGKDYNLQPGRSYTVSLTSDSQTTASGVLSASNTGDLQGNLNISGLPPGFYTVNINGTTRSGESIDIYKVIYVGTDPGDTGGLGAASQCQIVVPSGRDIDQDGVDDACDSFIGTAPALQYPVKATLTGNYIQVTKP